MSEAFVKLDFACNQKCLFCCTSYDKDRLTTQEAKDLIKKYIEEFGYKMITFTGGEPTIRKDLAELIAYAKSFNVHVRLQSNGLMLSSKEYTKSLVNAGMDSTLISIHSYDPRVNDFITKVPASLKSSIQGIKNLLDLKIPVDLSYVICKKNTDLIGFVKFIKKEFPQINHFNFFLSWPMARGWENKEFTPRLRDIEKDLHEMFEYCKKHKIHFTTRGIPLCYINGFEMHSVETQGLLSNAKPMIINDYEVLEPKHSFEDSNIKEPQCKFCSLNNKCGGVWRNYDKIYKYDLWPVN